MAAAFETTTPNGLLGSFKKAIDQGHVTTWAYDTQGDFWHKPGQWANQGWLRPKVVDGVRLRFTFLGRDETTPAAYGVLQGRMIESMTNHCANQFTVATSTAKAAADDARVRAA